MSDSANLYDTLYDDDDDDLDPGMLALNEMYGHLNFDAMSNYITLDSYNKTNPSDGNVISIFHFNIRSLEYNLVHLEALLGSMLQSPDIIAITETWLNSENMNCYSLDGYDSYHVVREKGKHGGVSIFIKDSLNYENIEDFTFLNSLIEICTVRLTINNIDYTIAAVYRPSSKNLDLKAFRKELAPILKNPIFKKSKSIFIGDFNIDLLIHSIHKETNEFLNLFQTFGYMPLITRATRFPQGKQAGNPSLLDHIYIIFTPPSTSGILHYDITDHLPIYLNFQMPEPINNSFKIKFRIFNQDNEQKFTRKLAFTLWEELLTKNDANENFDIFYLQFEKMYNECFPITCKTISSKRIERPWLSNGLITSIKNKNKLFKNFKLGISSEQNYKTYKNKLVNLLKTAKKRYYLKLFNSYKSNTKKIWQAINSLTKTKSRQTKISNIFVRDKNLNTALEISEGFNNFFTNVSSDLESKLPAAQSDPMMYLPPRIMQAMEIPRTNANEVSSVIRSLKNKKCRTNDFSPSVLKRNVHLLAQPLTLLLNQSFEQGIFPNRLKLAHVIPLYKKGAKSDPNNYRPISLLNIFSKIFEKVMKKKFIAFIDSNHILTSAQFGFQKNISTEDALSIFSKNIYKQLNKSNSVLSIFIDFAKAFDTVPHHILIQKLEHYGIRGSVLNWFSNYLTHRFQSTSYENYSSSPKEIRMGVPQGSVLGPLLFLIFINDLPNVSNLLSTILFADDATMSLCGKDPATLINLANQEMLKFYTWCTSNRLTVNTLKTFFILFSKRKVSNLPPLLMKCNLSYAVIKQVSFTKFLGVYYDSDMTFKTHINQISQRLSRISALIYKVKNLMPQFTLKTLYHAHVAPILNYCNKIWANTYPTHLDSLIKVQKRIVRTLTNSEFLAHTPPLFQQLNLLSIEKVRKYNLGLYFYKNRLTLLPELQGHHHYPTRYRERPRPEIHSCSIYEKSFLYQAPKLWNELIDNIPTICTAVSLQSFKKQLKRYLLTS